MTSICRWLVFSIINKTRISIWQEIFRLLGEDVCIAFCIENVSIACIFFTINMSMTCIFYNKQNKNIDLARKISASKWRSMCCILYRKCIDSLYFFKVNLSMTCIFYNKQKRIWIWHKKNRLLCEKVYIEFFIENVSIACIFYSKYVDD